MNYYMFHIGDYLKSTSHLSNIEDLAYRRLLDRYYDTQKPLETDVKKLCRFIRLNSYETETQAVLDEFFKLTKNGWIQKRVEKELKAYSAKAHAARVNGAKGGRPKKTQSVILANPTLTQEKANQEPLTNNHKPLTNKFIAPSAEDAKDYFLERGSSGNEAESFIDFYKSKNWYVGKNKMKDWKAAARNWIRKNQNKPCTAITNQPVKQSSFVDRHTDNSWANDIKKK